MLKVASVEFEICLYGGEKEGASSAKIKENVQREARITEFYLGMKLTN